jgi:hypothetical protein
MLVKGDDGGGNKGRIIPNINMTKQSVIQIVVSGRVIRVNGKRCGQWIMFEGREGEIRPRIRHFQRKHHKIWLF